MDSTSHISKMGLPTIWFSITLTISTNGMANKKETPNATHFLVFPMRAKAAAKIHRNTIAAAATAAPTEKTSFTSVKMPNKNR